MAMEAKLKTKWIKALRSGRFKQTKYSLEDSSGFCCLGVLCKVAGFERTTRLEKSMFSKDLVTVIKYISPDTRLTLGSEIDEKTLKKIGLTESQQSKLIKLNDDKDFTFKEIATFIGKNIKVKKKA